MHGAQPQTVIEEAEGLTAHWHANQVRNQLITPHTLSNLMKTLGMSMQEVLDAMNQLAKEGVSIANVSACGMTMFYIDHEGGDTGTVH